jgi:transcriptional regulator with XRE-family HTH domain
MSGESLLPKFARLLKKVREESGLTVRQLARVQGFAHSHVVRTTSTVNLPRWPRVRGYLDGCGVGGDVLYAWWELWCTVRSVEQELRRNHPAGKDRAWFWEMVERDWQSGLQAISKPDPLLAALRSVTAPDDLAAVISALVTRAGLDSIRKVEALTDIPRTTLNHWFNGTREPDPERLQLLVTRLDATDAERREFAQALGRIAYVACPERTRQSRPCVLHGSHRGMHRAANGEEWLEDGVLDGIRGPKQWVTEHLGQSAGPHW